LKEELRLEGVLLGSVEYGYNDNGNTRTHISEKAIFTSRIGLGSGYNGYNVWRKYGKKIGFNSQISI
jgi:hypothetical protein